MNIHPTSDISLRMGRLILEQKQINGQLTSMQNITYDRCPYQAVGRFYPPLGGASRASGLPRAAANAVSGQKPGPTLRPGAEDREKKSGSVDHRDCDAVDKEKSPCVKWSENKYENSPCLAVCTVVCLDYGRGRVPTPPRQAQANVGRCSRPFWTGGFLPPGPFSEDEKYSRIKAGVAVGASGQSHLPAVRAVTGSFRCIKSGVKNSRRGLRLRSRFPRGYCRNEKTGVTRVFSATRDTLFRLDAPSKIAPHETKIEALPGAGKCDAQQKKDRDQEM